MIFNTTTDLASPLLKLGDALGVPANVWAESEGISTLELYERNTSRTSIEVLDLDLVRSALSFYGRALTVVIRLGRVEQLPLTADIAQAQLDAFLDATRSSQRLLLDLILDKVQLINSRWGERPGCRPFLFLFESVARDSLTIDMSELERDFFLDDQRRKAILILPDHDVFLDGPHLAIIGGTSLNSWSTIQPTTPAEAQRALRVYSTCRKQLNWQRDWVQLVTPFHLALDHLHQGGQQPRTLPARSAIFDTLYTHFINLAILFTAQRSDSREENIFSTYSSASRTIEVPLRQPMELLPSANPGNIRELLRVINWAYEEDHPSSRFALLQDIFVRELLAVDEQQRYEKLVQSSSNAIQQLDWRWEFFIKDQVDAYLAQMRDLENDVDKAVQSFADQLGALTKGLTDTMLGAVAAVLAALVASVIKDKFNPLLFTLGIVAYGLYVAIFHLWYSLGYQDERFKAIQADYSGRKNRFAELIPTGQIDHVVGGRITDCSTRWKEWYDKTKLAYIGLLIVLALCVVAAWVVGPKDASGTTATATPVTRTATP